MILSLIKFGILIFSFWIISICRNFSSWEIIDLKNLENQVIFLSLSHEFLFFKRKKMFSVGLKTKDIVCVFGKKKKILVVWCRFFVTREPKTWSGKYKGLIVRLSSRGVAGCWSKDVFFYFWTNLRYSFVSKQCWFVFVFVLFSVEKKASIDSMVYLSISDSSKLSSAYNKPCLLLILVLGLPSVKLTTDPSKFPITYIPFWEVLQNSSKPVSPVYKQCAWRCRNISKNKKWYLTFMVGKADT